VKKKSHWVKIKTFLFCFCFEFQKNAKSCSPLTRVSAQRQAKAERSMSIECKTRENSWIPSSQSPKLCLHWFRCNTVPLQNTNRSDSGWILQMKWGYVQFCQNTTSNVDDGMFNSAKSNGLFTWKAKFLIEIKSDHVYLAVKSSGFLFVWRQLKYFV